MEAIELSFAEAPSAPDVSCAPREALLSEVPYPVDALSVTSPTLVNDQYPLDWRSATGLITGAHALVPEVYVRLDRTIRTARWRPPLFVVNTTGLASGNTDDEAVFHALCEVLEREAIYQSRNALLAHPIDVDAITEPVAARLIQQVLRPDGSQLELYDLRNSFAVPCVAALIRDNALALTFGGFGCHVDVHIAVSRAVTEAVQNRVSMIAGSRDDLPREVYDKQSRERVRASRDKNIPTVSLPTSLEISDLRHGVQLLAGRIAEHSGYEPLVIRLSAPTLAIAVVRVVTPGLQCDAMHDLRMTPQARRAAE
jgi:ribosomal protein S12 methylthiotransferase accessory factor